MQGAKAYILPAIAALVLLGYWLFVPPADERAESSEPSPTPEAPAAPAGPLDRALDEAIAACGAPASADVESLKARIVAGDDGKARIESIELVPTNLPDDVAVVACLRGLAGASLQAKGPIAPVTRMRSY